MFRLSNGQIFGVQASELWSKWMQWADAAGGHTCGYERMKRKYQTDPPRLEYIEELYEDPKKALFKIEWTFTNAVVIDVCECLFSALKCWTSGNSGQSVSLLMAVARIVEGIRLMMLKPFVYPGYGQSFLKKTVSHQPSVLKYLFHRFCQTLTKRATETMFKAVTSCWSEYDIKVMDEFTSVTHRRSGDEFVVDNSFQCFCNHKQCWIQLYTGLVCKHGLLSGIEQIRKCEEEEEKDIVIQNLIDVCHPNWLQKTYTSKKMMDVPIPGPPPSVYDVPSSTVTSQKRRWINRFQEVIKYLPPR